MSTGSIFRPEWDAFESELGFRPLVAASTAAEIRNQDMQLGMALMKKYAGHFPPPDPTVKMAEHSTASGVRVKSYTPDGFILGKPAVVYFHGGGFVVADVDRDDALVAQLARETGLVFASVEYSLAPEHRYPTSINDCVKAARFCIANADALKTDGSIVLMGGSAGGALALGTALKLIDGGDDVTSLRGVAACQPMVLHPDAVPEEYRSQYTSYDEHADHTLNSAQAMRAFFEIHGAPRDDPYIQSLLHPRLKDIPRVYINACECDTLRDDGRALHRTLDKLGVPNKYDEYKGLPHYFFSFPSPLLEKVREEYCKKTANGIAFVANGN